MDLRDGPEVDDQDPEKRIPETRCSLHKKLNLLLYDKNGKLYPRIVTRVNKRDGGVLRGPIPLISDGSEKTVYFHSDPTVDLAVIPHGWPKSDTIDGKYLPENLITDKASIERLHIEEGTEVFFTQVPFQ